MTPAKRKAQQDSVKPEGHENSGKASLKRKPEYEELILPEEPQNIETKVRPPALTINIHSWTTPIVGIIMLIIGALAGFYARPTVLGQLPQNPTEQSSVAAIPTEDRSEAQQKLMASLTPKVRHFLGDPNAPVTIIEFGDFQ